MPLTRPKLLGCSVVGLQNTVGWNNQSSLLRATLVEDATDGDSFTGSSSNIGTPISFSLGSFSFTGLLRKYTLNRDRNGSPTYDVEIIDPRQLLENAKIITADYNRTTTGIYNLFNVYGYLENTGYGNAFSNDTGMPYILVKNTLLTIANGVAGAFGGPISYRGTSYLLNLTELPVLPAYFRVGGHSHGMSILDFIQIICDAANYDFYIQLVGTTITLKTVARVNAYPLGTIGTMLTTTFADQVIRSADGLETREETTSTFLIGGDVHQLYQVDPEKVYRFWGFDDTGTILYGDIDTKYATFYANAADGSPNYEIYSYPVKRYNLYTPEIASFTGTTFYTTNDLELEILLGLGNNRDTLTTWMHYLYRANRDTYNTISLGVSPFTIQPPNGVGLTPANIINTLANTIFGIQLANRGALAQTGLMRLRLVYETLHKYAKDYYGKKYALVIPNVSKKADPETGMISNSHDISEGGWVDASDSTNDLLGLPDYASDLFQTQDGRYVAFTRYDSFLADLSRVNPTNSLVDPAQAYLYVKARMNPDMYFDSSGTALVVAEVDPVYDYPDSMFGMSGLIGALAIATGINFENSLASIQQRGADVLNGLQRNNAQGSIPYIIHPAARLPSGFEVPIKSNILTYGPWYAQGNTGRVIYEQDSSLVPWNYGGYSGLNAAGNAKALQGISAINIIETGYVEVPNEPAYNIGDVIQANGPNITNISIDISAKNGVTTTYRFETYVPRFGQLGKYNVDLLKRTAITQNKVITEAKARNRLNALAIQAQIEGDTTLSLIPMMFDALNIRSPQNMLVSTVVQGSGGKATYPIVSTATYKESLGFIPPASGDYNATAIATIDSVISPYAIKHSGNLLPSMQQPNGIWNDSTVLTSDTLTPYPNMANGWTNRIYTKGKDTYEEINDDFRIGENLFSKEKRVFGLKGPIVITGWGYNISGVRTPSGTDYATNYSNFRSGPVDLLWDEYRNTWTSHDILNGKTEALIAASGNGSVRVYVKGSKSYVLNTYNVVNTQVSSGIDVNIGYVASDNRWYILNGIAGAGSAGSGISALTGDAGAGSCIGPTVSEQFTSNRLVPISLGVSEFSPHIFPSGNNILYHFIPDAGVSIQHGLIKCSGQQIAGQKQFQDLIAFHNNTVPYNVTTGLDSNYIDTDAPLIYSDYDSVLEAPILKISMAPVNTSPIRNRAVNIMTKGENFGSTTFPTFGGSGLILVLTGSDLLHELPAFAISSSFLRAVGTYGYDAVGNYFAGGICAYASAQIPLGGLPSGNDLASLLPSGNDKFIQISVDDTTAGYGFDKIVAGSGLLTEIDNFGANETLKIHSIGQFLIDGADTTFDYASNKIINGSGIFLEVGNVGGSETLKIHNLGQFLVGGDDNTLGNAENKLIAGSGMFLQVLNPGGNEQFEFNTNSDIEPYVPGSETWDTSPPLTVGEAIQRIAIALNGLSINP